MHKLSYYQRRTIREAMAKGQGNKHIVFVSREEYQRNQDDRQYIDIMSRISEISLLRVLDRVSELYGKPVGIFCPRLERVK